MKKQKLSVGTMGKKSQDKKKKMSKAQDEQKLSVCSEF